MAFAGVPHLAMGGITATTIRFGVSAAEMGKEAAMTARG